VGQGLAEEAAGQFLVVDARLAEEAVEGAPVVALGEAQGQEGLGDGAPGEGEEMSEDESPRPKEGALLTESGAVG
jgi:hypothetical protein